MAICDKSLCTGCSVCADVCPQQCIEMKYDSKGFLHSFVDDDKCVNCKKCVSVCPVNNPNNKSKVTKAYKVRRNDPENAINSTSGGVAAVLSEYIVENGGFVVGCEMDENLLVKHSIADNVADLEKFKGSKYVQSKTTGIYKEVKNLLNEGKTILFVGTPCQVSALNNFLVKPYENLYTVDLVCHGVMSQKVFDKYVDSITTRENPVLEVKFRNKSRGYTNGGENSMQYVFANETKTIPYDSGVGLWFAACVSLRDNCYNCDFASTERCADISLADYNGSEFTPEEKIHGVSRVFVNTSKGAELFESVTDRAYVEDGDVNTYIKLCRRLYHKTEIPAVRDKFFADLEKLSIEQMITKYTLKKIIPGKFSLYLNAIKRRLNK